MKNKLLVIGTVVGMLALASVAVAFSDGGRQVNINTQGQLTLGDPYADVNVLLFIDLRCSSCKYYEERIFPLIKRRYIDTNKIAYTIIPLAFLKGSTRLFQGYYCTRKQDPSLGMEYIQTAYKQDDVPILNGISRTMLETCMGSGRVTQAIDYNMEIAEDAMGKRNVMTPTVFVNGRKVSEPTYTAISNAIDEALK